MRQGLNEVLAAVSRSFYLTICVLPSALREPIGLAYLLARLSDTVADSAGAPSQLRLGALGQMREALRGCGRMPDFAEISAGIPDPSERILLAKAEALFELLEATDPNEQAEIVWVLEEILRGQILDLERFAEGGPRIRSLATAQELEDYTYSVAGCVGEFWTRICSRHLRNYAPVIEPDRLLKLGAAFGKGLQLVNILRDAPADMANGRCYFPMEEMEGISPEAWRTAPALARSVHDRWMMRAREQLDEGLQYIEAVRPWRLRLACFLPWALGVRTLHLMAQCRPLEAGGRLKVSRKQVRWLFLLGVFGSLGNFALRHAVACVRKA